MNKNGYTRRCLEEHHTRRGKDVIVTGRGGKMTREDGFSLVLAVILEEDSHSSGTELI